MAIAYKCDICKKLYERYKKDYHKIEINGLALLKTNGYVIQIGYDLCPDCMEAVIKLIETRSKQEGELEKSQTCKEDDTIINQEKGSSL